MKFSFWRQSRGSILYFCSFLFIPTLIGGHAHFAAIWAQKSSETSVKWLCSEFFNFSIFQFFNFSIFQFFNFSIFRFSNRLLIFFGCKMVVFIEKKNNNNNKTHNFCSMEEQWGTLLKLKRTILRFHCSFWLAFVVFRGGGGGYVPKAKMFPTFISNSGGKRKQKISKIY